MKKGYKAWLNKLEGKSEMWAEHYVVEDWLLLDEGTGQIYCGRKWKDEGKDEMDVRVISPMKNTSSQKAENPVEKEESFFTI